jgi:CheY-like chemotaxis protein
VSCLKKGESEKAMETRILIVDDSDCSAETLEAALLELRDVRILRAASGHEAWTRIQDETVSAVITDLNMPRMDGFELIERVRARAATPAIPIVVVSADSAPGIQEKAMQLGANAFFVKPYSPAAVRETVEDLLHALQSRDST